MDSTRLQAARAIKEEVIQEGLTNTKLTGWQPANTKPRKQELWWALMERDPSVRPKNWGAEKIVEKLMAWEGELPPTDHFTSPDTAPDPGPEIRYQMISAGSRHRRGWRRRLTLLAVFGHGPKSAFSEARLAARAQTC